MNIQDEPELKSKQTIHLFDATAGPNSYGITRIVDGAKQVVFSSIKQSSYYAQLARDNRIYRALLPSTTKEEFYNYATILAISKDVVDAVLKLSGYGKVRPLGNLNKLQDRLNRVIKIFDMNRIEDYVSIDNRLTRDDNPAIVMDASPAQHLDQDEQDLKRLDGAYRYGNAVWRFASDYIINQILDRYGSNFRAIVDKLNVPLHDNFGRTFGPAYGRLLEIWAVRSITKFGLICEPAGKIEEISQV
jgi:hypothetical protein